MFQWFSSGNMEYNKYKDILEYIPNNNNKIKNIKYEDCDIVKCMEIFANNERRDKYIVSLSGGVDSMVVASILNNLGYDVVACHINYNNRTETKDEQKFLEEWCKYNDINLYVKEITGMRRGDVKRSDYELETKIIRFNFYREIMIKEKCGYIILGHHKDDIVENIFANVCRGRYILDLAVIKHKSIVNNVMMSRPLIGFYKDRILEFAHKNNVPYFKDTTPLWSVRGKYRNEIYPRIKDAFSTNVKNNLIGLSNQSYEWNGLIQKAIIYPFMKDIKYDDDNKSVEFNIENYRDYPLCFWNEIFANIFYRFNNNCPSRKGIRTFMSCVKKKGVCNASISNSCNCYIKNNNVKIDFKNNI